MQIPGPGDDLRLDFYLKDSDSKADDDCPAFYRTDRGWGAQGMERYGDAVRAQMRGYKPGETFVELPDSLIHAFVRKYVKDTYGIDLPEGPPEAHRSGL
ncbi:hypothetical protein GCM10027589_11040 [Actinocorallia lasiicapitis]